MDSNNPQPRRSEEMTEYFTQQFHTESVSRAAPEYSQGLKVSDEKPLQAFELFRTGLGFHSFLGKCCTAAQDFMMNKKFCEHFKRASLCVVQLQHLTESNHLIGGGRQ